MEKSDFMNYRALVMEVRQIRARLTELELARFSTSSPNYSGAPGSSDPHRCAMVDRSVKYLEAKAFYEEKLDQRDAQLLVIERAIESLASPIERLVMRARYIQGRSWASICTALQREGYSERQVYRLHGDALLKLKEV